ncbi:MAG: NUDIX hydrolase [Candidatus Peregrinibacteria bacterium]|nr:NUDIX hydrolase [Candidatus Peregrinibacteria bacterium]
MRELFNHRGWRITEESAPLPDGRSKSVVRVHRCDSVHIIAFDAEGRVLVLREFRPFYGTYVWMLPSGRIDKESDRTVAAQRELQEETGFRAGELTYYCSTRHSESFNSANHVFIARNLSPSPLPQDEDELIEVHPLPLAEAIDRVLASEPVHTASAFALLKYAHERRST